MCRKHGIPWKYIVATETKRMTNVHHHVILPKMDTALIEDAWSRVVEGGTSLRPLDKRGNHGKLANYLIKETRSTAQRCKELGRRFKRYSCAKGMDKPIIKYQKVKASGWRKEPKARKGYTLFKFDDGATARSGWHDFSGYPYQEYYEILIQPPERGKANEHQRARTRDSQKRS